MKLLRIIPPQDWMLIRKNWILQIVHKFVIFFSVVSLVVIAISWHKLPPLIPLWYSRPWGIDQLAPPIFLLILPVLSIIVYAINVLLSMYALCEYLIFCQTLMLSSLLVSILSCIAVIKIIILVL